MDEPIGGLNKPLLACRNLIAACPSWREWCGCTGTEAAQSADALSHVHLLGVNPPPSGMADPHTAMAAFRPLAVLFRGAGGHQRIFHTTGPAVDSGIIVCRFEATVPTVHVNDDESAEMWFTNYVGRLLDDFAEMDEGRGFLVPRRASVVEDWARIGLAEEPGEGDWMSMVLQIDWGFGAA